MKNGIDFALALAVGFFALGPAAGAQTLGADRVLNTRAQSESAAATQNPSSELADSFRRQAELVGMAPARATIRIGPRRIKLEVGKEIPFTLDRQKRNLRLDSMNTDDPSHPIATFHYEGQVIELGMDLGGEESPGDDTRPASSGTGPIHLDASDPSFPTSLLAPGSNTPAAIQRKTKRRAPAKSASSNVIFGNKKPSAKSAKKKTVVQKTRAQNQAAQKKAAQKQAAQKQAAQKKIAQKQAAQRAAAKKKALQKQKNQQKAQQRKSAQIRKNRQKANQRRQAQIRRQRQIQARKRAAQRARQNKAKN